MAKFYEISFWIKKDYEPEKIEDKILKILEDLKFELVKKIPSKMKSMAYPIKKEISGYFGTIYFSGEPEKIFILNQKIKAIPEILRYITLKRKAIKVQPETNQTKESVQPKLEEAVLKNES